MNNQLTPSETEELKTLTNLWNCSEITAEGVARMEHLDRKALNHLPQIISLGAGVQSSTMALMAAHGEIGPRPIAAVFADTQAEPASVMRWLDVLEGLINAAPFPFPIHRVTAGSLLEGSLRVGTRKDGAKWIKGHVPAFVKKPDGTVGPLWRTCTADYKLAPLMRKQRELAGIKRGQKTFGLVSWIGISIDEAQRMKPSREPWAVNAWPLVDAGMNRNDCLRWMEEKGYPKPPRSACTFCPFHSDAEWNRLKTKEPDAFAHALSYEKRLQIVSAETGCHAGRVTLHRSGKNIDEVDFNPLGTQGQQEFFANECEGMCGV